MLTDSRPDIDAHRSSWERRVLGTRASRPHRTVAVLLPICGRDTSVPRSSIALIRPNRVPPHEPVPQREKALPPVPPGERPRAGRAAADFAGPVRAGDGAKVRPRSNAWGRASSRVRRAPGAVRNLSIWRAEIGGRDIFTPTETAFFRGSGSVRGGCRRISPRGAACAGTASWERRVFQTRASRPHRPPAVLPSHLRAGRPRSQDARIRGRRRSRNRGRSVPPVLVGERRAARHRCPPYLPGTVGPGNGASWERGCLARIERWRSYCPFAGGTRAFPGRRSQERSREACPAKTPPRTCLDRRRCCRPICGRDTSISRTRRSRKGRWASMPGREAVRVKKS